MLTDNVLFICCHIHDDLWKINSHYIPSLLACSLFAFSFPLIHNLKDFCVIFQSSLRYSAASFGTHLRIIQGMSDNKWTSFVDDPFINVQI